MSILIHPTYFSSISQYIAIAQAKEITFETQDNYQKQTARNRMYIYSPNGLQLLNIPIKHSKEAHQKYKDVRIENDFNWQKNHFKSLEAAYRTSPFFEYFEDDIYPIFHKKQEFLMDLNLQIFDIICSCIGLKITYQKTEEYFKNLENAVTDFRWLANTKKDNTQIEPYKQVFDEKHDFLNNLSILDLLFNEGKYTLEYLEQQQLPFIS